MRKPKIIKRVGTKLKKTIMKIKVLLLAAVICLGSYAAYACSHSECGSGNVKCCTDVFGALYYCKGGGE